VPATTLHSGSPIQNVPTGFCENFSGYVINDVICYPKINQECQIRTIFLIFFSKLSSSVFGDSKEAPELVRLFVSFGFLNEKAERYKKTTAFKKPRREKGLRQVADTFFFKNSFFILTNSKKYYSDPATFRITNPERPRWSLRKKFWLRHK
jgi:hypothetical protein